MNRFNMLFNKHKKVWMSKQLKNYKGLTYYRFNDKPKDDRYLAFDRFYPNTGNWLVTEFYGTDYIREMKAVKSKEIISMLEAEHAKFLLIQ